MWHQDRRSCQQCHLRFNPFPSALANARPRGPAGQLVTQLSLFLGGQTTSTSSPQPQFSPGVLFPILGNCQANTANNHSTRDRKILLNSRYLVSSFKKKKTGWGGGETSFLLHESNRRYLLCKSVALPLAPTPPRFPTLSPFKNTDQPK